MIARAILVLLSLAVLTGAQLPDTGPMPLKKPVTAAPVAPEPQSVPVPTSPQPTVPPSAPQKPSPAPPEKSAPADADAPAPAGKPGAEKPATATDAEKPAEQAPPQPPAEPPPRPIQAESDADFASCRMALSALGAEFSPETRIDDDGGCGIDKPIRISRLLTGVALSPEATIRCETALELARWVRTVVIPAAETAMPDKGRLSSVNQASGYVCRKRNNAATGKISEHASGNAIDLVSLSFANGTVPLIIAGPEDSTLAAAFQRALNATACLYFTTVLSPGSDAAHQDHMHLDVLERKGGFRYCR